MITIGVDAHQQVHQAVALDAQGRELDGWRGPNSHAGWAALAAWAGAVGAPRRWGIEGAYSAGRGLAQHLVALAEPVCEVNTRWTAAGRRPDKTDRLDAIAVARVCPQEEALPRVGADDETAVLDLLVTERDALLAEATRLRNRAHALLLQLDPEYRRRLPSLTSQASCRALARYAAADRGPLQQERAAAVRRLGGRLIRAGEEAAMLARQIKERARPFAALTGLCGVSLLTAGALAGILGPGRRFPSDAQLAAYAGAAPIEAASAGRSRHRLNRGGDRRLNAILYRIALTQARYSDDARAYLQRRRAEGKSRREAVRAFKRYLVRAIWRLWQECAPEPSAPPACT